MRVLIRADEEQQREWMTIAPDPAVRIYFVQKFPVSPEVMPVFREELTHGPAHLPAYEAFTPDLCIDCLYDGSPENIRSLTRTGPALCLLSSLLPLAPGLPFRAARFNGWPGFLSVGILEAATADEGIRKPISAILALLGRRPEWVADTAGLVTPRIIAAIINEAWLTLEEGISDRESIDLAMKLGTNYPFGPFEWTERIGSDKIVELYNALPLSDRRKGACKLLIQNALAQ